MARPFTILVVAGMAFGITGATAAQDLAWRCQVVEVWVPNDKGTLVPAEQFGEVFEDHLGDKFEVSRETGRIEGGPFVSSDDVKRQIVRGGGPEWHFVRLNTLDGTTELLRVMAYVEKPKKPFLAVGIAGAIYTGTCH